MSSVNVFVGLDYHQDQVQVCVLNQAGEVLCNRSVPNQLVLIEAAVKRHGEVQAVALEACCGAANLADELTQLGWSVSLAHPGFVSRMKQNPDKTDFSDAQLLADLLRVGYLPKVWLAPEALRRLRRLVRYRQQVVDQRRDAKLRIRALLRENRIRPPRNCNPWTKTWLHWLKTVAPLQEEDRWLMDEHLAALEKYDDDLNRVTDKLKRWAESDAVIQKLLQFRGVGLVTAVTMRAEIGCFSRFRTGKQLSRFCGVTPRNASSGHRQADAGLIRAGNPQLRRVLIELSHRLINSLDRRWAGLAYQLMKNGKKRNVTVCAVANRWVRWLHHQMQPEQLAA
jgi:transposase